MSSTDWFAIQRLRRGVYLIAEPMHVNSYLIVGSRRAVLFDTGLGIGRIRTQVDDITDLPITVINSHHHFDHVGGNAEFDDIAVHEAGVEHHRAGPPPSWLRAFCAVSRASTTTTSNSSRWTDVGSTCSLPR